MTRVHVLLPVYNAANTLRAVLDSVACQTYEDFTCWVMDDGSDDASAEIAASFDTRFCVQRLPHGGIVHALNEGLARIGAAEYIARVDADDVCHPERFALQVAALDADARVDLVATQCDVVREDQDLGWGMARYMTWANQVLSADEHFRARYIESPIAHSSVMARLAVFEGGYRAVPWFEDYDLWLRRLNGGARFTKVAQRLVRVLDRPDRTSRVDVRCTPEALMACKLHHLQRDVLATRPAVVVWGAGRVAKRWLRALPEVGVQVPFAIELHPRRIGKTIHGARILAAAELPWALERIEQPLVLVAVGAPGARTDIRARMETWAYKEGVDYLFVA